MFWALYSKTASALDEKGGKRHEMPCHKLEMLLEEYTSHQATSIKGAPKG